jgi:hypothetical protein
VIVTLPLSLSFPFPLSSLSFSFVISATDGGVTVTVGVGVPGVPSTTVGVGVPGVLSTTTVAVGVGVASVLVPVGDGVGVGVPGVPSCTTVAVTVGTSVLVGVFLGGGCVGGGVPDRASASADPRLRSFGVVYIPASSAPLAATEPLTKRRRSGFCCLPVPDMLRDPLHPR